TLSDSGTLSITVSAVNDRPQAQADTATTAEDTVLVVNAASGVLANDSDVDGPSLSVSAATVATAQGGSITFAADGSYSYTPAANFAGVDTVAYTVSDGTLSDSGTLSITVSAVNDRPQAQADTATTAEDTVLVVNAASGVLANDSDVDGPSLSVSAATVATAQGGSITFAADGSYSYTPAANFAGVDTVAYTVSDGTLSDSGT